MYPQTVTEHTSGRTYPTNMRSAGEYLQPTHCLTHQTCAKNNVVRKGKLFMPVNRNVFKKLAPSAPESPESILREVGNEGSRREQTVDKAHELYQDRTQ